jgi:hypothetical protein
MIGLCGYHHYKINDTRFPQMNPSKGIWKMHLFIFSCLSFLVIAVMLLIVVQIIRIEKTITNLNIFAEAKVKKMYGKK